jgi:NADH-quinone oxidoreductase subunit M
MIGDMSGIAGKMPVTATVFVAGAFAYMGLPLMAGFMAELFVFIGAFESTVLPAAPLFTAAAMFGIVIVAGYLLWAMQRSLFGPFRLETDYDLGRAPIHDLAPLLTLVVLIIALGIAPDIFFEMIRDATLDVIDFDFGGDI